MRLAVHLRLITLALCAATAQVAADEQAHRVLVVSDRGFTPVASLLGFTLTGAEGKVLSAVRAD